MIKSLCAMTVVVAALAGCGGSDGAKGQDASDQLLLLAVEGRSTSQGFNASAAEITAFDSGTGRIFTVNALSGKVDVFAASNATQIAALANPSQSIDLAAMLLANGFVNSVTKVGPANSVAVNGNLVAVAMEANPKTDNGWVVFLNTSTLAYVRAVQVGALPDMLIFTPDGTKVLVANEGEPNVGYSDDPEGSVSVIRVSDFTVSTIGFGDFNVGGSRNSELPASKMVLSGMAQSIAKDLEPEYIAVREDGLEAYVTLQEASAIAVLDLNNNTVKKIIGMGFKDHTIPGNEIDASQQDGVNIKTWPVMGMYQPDSIAAYTVAGRTYLVTANEGDSREDWLNGLTTQATCEAAGYYFYGTTPSNAKCRDELALRDAATATGFSVKLSTELAGLTTDTTLGRLKFSYQATLAKNGTTINRLYAYGARSFSIWDAQTGERVYDSGSDIERITANRYASLFNQDHNGSLSGDKRSNSKGPEPEGLALGQINGRTYAFIGLERMGGVMVYDVSNPSAASFVQYLNNRDITRAPDTASVSAGSDLGPEGLTFINGSKMPDGKPRLIVGNEVSGTTTVYLVNVNALR
jgi:DNA-binding beta-propeller fold protein YncE